jgi:hypothetical protein
MSTIDSDSSDSREITPRNIVWVEDDCLNFREADYGLLTDSYYTHAIVCFFHLDPGPKLVYNGKDRDPYGPEYDQWWKYLQGLRQGPLAKTLMLSVGGWNSGTWTNAQKNIEDGARQIVAFAQAKGFDGIDFNFEGDYQNDEDPLDDFAKLVVAVRKIWNGLFTITPIYGHVENQLEHIRNAGGRNDDLSWINVQFYTYGNGYPYPEPGVVANYKDVLFVNSLPAKMVTAGFPLSETDLAFNQGELQTATGEVKQIYSAYPDFAGMFAWRFRGVFLGNYQNQPLVWDRHFSDLLHNR